MDNPHAIKIHCDGAMDYDKYQTGGNGFVIEFPDYFNKDPVEKSISRTGHGIHQLEMISILEAIEELIKIYKDDLFPRTSSGVLIFTDRHSVPSLLNPYAVREYRNNDWNNHEGKPIKDKVLIDRIDKARVKLSQKTGGRVEIKWKDRKKNRPANNLAKAAKRRGVKSKLIISVKKRNITKRLYDGPEIDYSNLKSGDYIYIRVYAWERVNDMYEITSEITDGDFEGRTLKIYSNKTLKDQLHRSYRYKIKIQKSNKYHVLIESVEEN